jgi:glycosyltransferase AglD
VILGSSIHDHQCGFKAFKKKEVLLVLEQVKSNSWFWDTELLVLAQRKGLNIDEFPVKWRAKPGGKVRVFRDGLGMFFDILRMRFLR